MPQRIVMVEDDSIQLVTPSGHVIDIQYSNLEPGDQFPELDIMLEGTLMANCFGEALAPATSDGHPPNCLASKQIIIVLEPIS